MSTYSTQITFIQDGDTVEPINDVSIWLKCGGVKASYTTMEEVLADNDTMYALMSDENAMKYLARSTGFADAGCANETFMTYLGQSPYVDDTVLNSDLWVSAISSSNYYELVYSPIIVHSSASATISFNGKSFTSDASGNTSKVIPWGTFTFSDSVSGQSYERTIDKNTTDLYIMPEGALYWYGNQCGYNITYDGVSLKYETNRIIASQNSYKNWGVIFTDSINVTKYSKICAVANATYGWFAIFANLDGSDISSVDSEDTQSNYFELSVHGNILTNPRIAGGTHETNKAVVNICAFWLE